MSYTIIWFSKHDPDAMSKTLHVSRFALWGCVVAVLVGLPLLSFFIGYRNTAPERLQERLEAQITEFTDLSEEASNTKIKYQELQKSHQQLQDEYLSETGRRAEMEARVSIVENVRASALERLEKAEKREAELQSKLKMFEDIFKPAEEALPVQCFNISVKDRSKSIKYAVTLMKSDKSDSAKLDMSLQLRVMTGSTILSLGEDTLEDADRTRETSLTRQMNLSGSIRGNFAKKGMRVLDIRGYDSTGKKLLTHCWKTF